MTDLMKAEWFKLKKQKLVVVLIAAVIAISGFSSYSEISFLMAPDHPVTGKVSFSNAFQDISMLFLIAVFVGFYVGSDFSNRTIQAELSKGHKRLDIILSKAFVCSIVSCMLMLLYPVTVCLIHTLKFGWGEPFTVSSAFYMMRVVVLGSILNTGTAAVYVCFAFLCRDIPKTICVCFAFPVVCSVISSTIGRQIPVIGMLLDFSTLSQSKYIVSDILRWDTVGAVMASACITWIAALAVSSFYFSKAEIK